MGFRGGRGGGRRGGHGWRRMFGATGLPGWMRYAEDASGSLPGHPEMQKQGLERQADELRSELDLVMKRLAALDTGSTAK